MRRSDRRLSSFALLRGASFLACQIGLERIYETGCPWQKQITYALVVAIGMSFLFQEVAYSASRSFRRSGKSRASAMHSWHRFVRPSRSDVGFVLGWGNGPHGSKILSTPPVSTPRPVMGLGSLEGTSSMGATLSSSSYRPQLPTHPEKLLSTERTSSHSRWTAVTAWRS